MSEYAVMFTVDGDDVTLMLDATDLVNAETEVKVAIYGSPQLLDIYWYEDDEPGCERDVCWDEDAYMRFEDTCVENIQIVELVHSISAEAWQIELDGLVQHKLDAREVEVEARQARKNKTIATDEQTLTDSGFVKWVKKSHPNIVKKFAKAMKDPSVR